ncbi:GTPase [Calothrix sp. CCY 0018]|uniref:GTPase family protein n=1 Tax=Calothrix sp. CCY 0018 TaxID=3103864 RepID=UPI0039C6DEFF
MDKTDKFIDDLLSKPNPAISAKQNKSPEKQKSSYAEDLLAQVKPELDREQTKNTASNENLSESQSELVEKQIVILGETIKKYRHHLPEQRKPTILICGKIGNGKTTTINTIFGKKVGEVGHFSRGTDKDEVYEWQANTENINIVDLPGLGDSEKNDKIFQEIYRKHVKNADGFIIVVSPPRPAEYGTLKTAKLLIECGVSSKHIIFGFNQLSNLRYQQNDRLQQVQLDGLIGPTTPNHVKAIANAKEIFLNDLRKEIPEASFCESQIIEYDSLSGWNLHKMLHAVIEILPFEALAKLRSVTTEAQKEVKKKEEEQLKRELELILEKQEYLRNKEKELDSRQTREDNLFQKGKSLGEQLQQQINKAQAELKIIENTSQRRVEGLDIFGIKVKETDENIFDKVLDGIEETITAVNPNAGKVVRGAREVIRQVAPIARDIVDQVSTAIVDTGTKVVDAGTKAVKDIGNFVGKAWNSITSWW